jgi:L-threonylcarbamoyladenylate synthase
LAVNALNPKTVERVYKIKKRSKMVPLSIMVRDISMASKYALLDLRTKKLFKKFLPGPLTLVVRKKKLPKNLTAGKKSVGLRIPDCKVTKMVMRKINFPITATSANISGEKEPYSVKEILRQYKRKKFTPDLIVDAGRLPQQKPSTIIDLTSRKIKLIRKGPIRFEKIIKNLKINEML